MKRESFTVVALATVVSIIIIGLSWAMMVSYSEMQLARLKVADRERLKAACSNGVVISDICREPRRRKQ